MIEESVGQRAPRLTRRRGAQVGGAVWLLAVAGCRSGEAQPPVARTPATIRVLTRAGPAGHTGWYKDVTARLFQAQLPQVTVEWDEAAETTVTEKLVTFGASGTLPDVSWLGLISDGGRGGMRRGLFRPLDPLIKTDKFDKSVYWPALLDAMTLESQLFGLPTHGHFGPVIAYVNTELVKRAGLQVPLADGNWTLDEMIETARKLTRLAEGIAGFWPATSANEEVVVFTRTFGGDLLSPDGKRCLLDRPESIAGLEWLWSAPHRFQVVESLRGQGGPLAAFEQGRVGLVISGPARIAEWKGPGKERMKAEWATTVMPRHASGRRGSQVAGNGMGITRDAKQPAAGWEWIKFITNKENGINQVQGGAGSPGARNDVWSDARLLALDPAYGLVQRTYRAPAGLHLPQNEAFADVYKTVDTALAPAWDNQVAVKDAAQQAAREVQAILERPA
ncbi:MAG TPA: sugar ABC transporter substrate-binding protein [Chloroflexota bacterium]|nr:sugar ABC transporter substrate-binding protein [Chloroflexota bacterium]